jgi:hypothetical protein
VRRAEIRALLLLLGQVASACSERVPTMITVEGEISPELGISGEVQISTSTDFFMCKRNLLESAQPQAWYKTSTTSLRGNRYVLRFDLADAPLGGFCRWKLDVVRLEANVRTRPSHDDGLVALYDVQKEPPHLRATARRLPPDATLLCDIRPTPGMSMLQCDSTQRFFDADSKEVHLTLNVKYEKGHQEIND